MVDIGYFRFSCGIFGFNAVSEGMKSAYDTKESSDSHVALDAVSKQSDYSAVPQDTASSMSR